MDISGRLAQLISDLGETPASFSEKLGIQRSSVSHLVSARNKPSVDFLEKLLSVFPSVNLSWLIAGTGSMFVSAAVSSPVEAVPENTAPGPEHISPPPDPEPDQKSPGKQTAGRGNPVKILLLYTDGSFEVFQP